MTIIDRMVEQDAHHLFIALDMLDAALLSRKVGVSRRYDSGRGFSGETATGNHGQARNGRGHAQTRPATSAAARNRVRSTSLAQARPPLSDTAGDTEVDERRARRYRVNHSGQRRCGCLRNPMHAEPIVDPHFISR